MAARAPILWLQTVAATLGETIADEQTGKGFKDASFAEAK